MNDMTTINHEMASSAAAAQAKAEIESAFIMALKRPRKIEEVRDQVLAACRRPKFAESAEYSKPVGNGKAVKGPSIRFVEAALQALTNVRTATTVAYEDSSIRRVHVSMTDLENNNAYGLDATIQKTVERKSSKDRKILGERKNSFGETTYLVEATEDEMTTKQNAVVSKLIRTCGLRLIPQDIVEEAMDLARQTRTNNQGDPDAAKKKILDAFSSMGIKPSEVEKLICKRMEQALPHDIDRLRTIYTAIREGESVLADYIETVETKDVATAIADKLAAKEASQGQPTPGQPDPFAALTPQQIAQAKGRLGIKTMNKDLTDEQKVQIVKEATNA